MFTIGAIIAVSTFLILFSTSYDLSIFIPTQRNYLNPYFFLGAIHELYSDLASILIVLIFLISIVFIAIISYAFTSSQKKDISIMKAFGTLPGRIYKFYLSEVFFIFLIGFLLGVILGLSFYYIFTSIMTFLDFSITFEFNTLLLSILFILGCFSSLFTSAIFLERIGKKSIIQTFSKDVPYHFCVEKLKYIPKWLSLLGKNVKFSILNIKRRKGKFKQYFLIFLIISMIIFTVGLGTLVLRNTSKTWINKAQGEDILVIGHKNVVFAYAGMYSMFSNPNLLIHQYQIDLTDGSYLFNYSEISELETIPSLLQIDRRLLSFCNLQEIQGIAGDENAEIRTIGENRFGNFPVMGLNLFSLSQFYELEGYPFTTENANYTMIIGDGLANTFFEEPFNQRLQFIDYGVQFFISGIFIDTLYSGFASYMGLSQFQTLLEIPSDNINLLLLKPIPNTLEYSISQILPIIRNLGNQFVCINFETIFSENSDFIDKLTLYNLSVISLMALVSLLSLYNFQKGDLTDKIKDFRIMRALGSPLKNIRRILFFEGLFILISATLLSFAGGMIVNSLFLFENVILPPLYVPFLLSGIIMVFYIGLNSLTILPIIKKIQQEKFNEL
ncbi:MAG: membrane protein of unknown function [Promethearchaeota archaeon]|nr:MAG: membrane protein of unknown function [Candidatus Lokiarchaeota archaeon]